ncbi:MULTISPECIES: DUF6153 family protein [unclassified Streptomyces]|uniref:DUF6153 family protein n=1 Tax=unclassified Streptomyces TaxID=2593676 RepID=UPI0027E38E0A|nr:MULTISPECIES: DUF6153 family protein [unclassified Streptomyces]
MTARAQHHRALPLRMPGSWRVLLVLGLLAGLFGMHALGPGNAVAAPSHHAHERPMSAHVTALTAMTAMTDEAVCHSADSGGGHARHADPTCASGAVGAGPVLPALALDPAGTAVTGDLDDRSVAVAPDGGRAPPSLAELQILRT